MDARAFIPEEHVHGYLVATMLVATAELCRVIAEHSRDGLKFHEIVPGTPI